MIMNDELEAYLSKRSSSILIVNFLKADRFQFLNTATFWDITSCSGPKVNGRFGGISLPISLLKSQTSKKAVRSSQHTELYVSPTYQCVLSPAHTALYVSPTY